MISFEPRQLLQTQVNHALNIIDFGCLVLQHQLAGSPESDEIRSQGAVLVIYTARTASDQAKYNNNIESQKYATYGSNGIFAHPLSQQGGFNPAKQDKHNVILHPLRPQAATIASLGYARNFIKIKHYPIYSSTLECFLFSTSPTALT
jgi:hypothetical protein